MKTLLLSVLLLCIGSSAVFAQEEANPEPKWPEIKNLTEKGKKAPLFNIKDTDGSEFRLEDHHGKVVVLYFFLTTWCPVCQNEMPHLESDICRNTAPRVIL